MRRVKVNYIYSLAQFVMAVLCGSVDALNRQNEPKKKQILAALLPTFPSSTSYEVTR